MAQSASKSCDICMSGPGRNYCEQCDQWMCENCKTLHLRSKISRNHTFHNGPNFNSQKKLFCKQHDESYIFYCSDCDIPICKLCIVTKHKKHDMSEINESTHGLKAEVKQAIQSKIKFVKTNLDKIAKGTERYQHDVKEAIRDITEEGNQLKQWIDKKVQALVSSLQDNEAESLRALRSINIVFQNDMEILLKCQHAFTDSQKITDVTYLLTKLKHIESELDVVDEKQSLVMPTVKYNKKNVSERDMIDLFGDPSFQKISYCIEKVLQKKTRDQSKQTVFIYECSMTCGRRKLSEKKPTKGDKHGWTGLGNIKKCDNCGHKVWFKLIGEN